MRAAGLMKPRSRGRRAMPRRRLLLSQSLSRLAENLQPRRPVRSQNQHRKTVRSLPAPKPLNPSANALAYLGGEVCSGGSSATATRFQRLQTRSRVRRLWVISGLERAHPRCPLSPEIGHAQRQHQCPLSATRLVSVSCGPKLPTRSSDLSGAKDPDLRRSGVGPHRRAQD